jgi:bacteriochlorophyllide a dehydrogenase
VRGTAIAFTGRDRIEIVEIAVPDLRPDEVLIETDLTAVSQGTDRAMVTGAYRGMDDRYPFIYGYSRVGRVTGVGHAVQGLAIGDRVFSGMAGTRLDPADGYGEQGGAYTSHGVVHETDVVRLPDHVDATTAAIGPLAAIAYQGVVTSSVHPNSRVLVAGLGAIGQFSALFSRLRGAEVWAMDPVSARRELAVRLSKVKVLDPAEDIARRIEETAWGIRPWRGRNDRPASRYEQRRWAGATGSVDVVIDATGRADAFEAYIGLLAREGCLCLQGYYAKPLTLDFHAAHMKRLTIRCPGGMDQVDYETVLRLMPPANVAQLVGMVIPIAKVSTALPDLLFRAPSHVVCAIIDWRGEPSAP